MPQPQAHILEVVEQDDCTYTDSDEQGSISVNILITNQHNKMRLRRLFYKACKGCVGIKVTEMVRGQGKGMIKNALLRVAPRFRRSGSRHRETDGVAQILLVSSFELVLAFEVPNSRLACRRSDKRWPRACRKRLFHLGSRGRSSAAQYDPPFAKRH